MTHRLVIRSKAGHGHEVHGRGVTPAHAGLGRYYTPDTIIEPCVGCGAFLAEIERLRKPGDVAAQFAVDPPLPIKSLAEIDGYQEANQ
jgi:hypothetical protein